MAEVESISQGVSMLSNIGGNLVTFIVLGLGYFIYTKCGGSHCKYTREHGLELEFNAEEEDDDEEDRSIKNMMKLLMQRKSIKIQKKNSQENLSKMGSIRIPIRDSPHTLKEVLANNI